MLKQLDATMIFVGEPSPFDCLDAKGKLLLRKGVTVSLQNQMDALLARGLYFEDDPSLVVAEKGAAPMKIVIVDDNLSMRKILTALFQSQGHQVVASLEDGSGLSQCVVETTPDIVCLDQNMPGKTGLQLLIELQAAWPEIDVVMMTGSSDPALAGLAANAGASGFILKPFSQAQILEEIRHIEETRRIVAGTADKKLDLRVPGVSKGTVLIIDDSAVVRTLLKGILEDINLRVLPMVGNGEDGVEAARKHRPELVCLDVEMPRMSGLDALPLILQASPKSKVVMITGSPDKAFSDRAAAGGAKGYILKPVRPAYVEAFMKKLLG